MKKACLSVLLLLIAAASFAVVPLEPYGMSYAGIDSLAVDKMAASSLDSLINKSIPFPGARTFAIEQKHFFTNYTVEFYYLLFLTLCLGLIRYSYPRYFGYLFKAFLKPGLSKGSIKDQLQNERFPNLLMNIFFCLSTGTYVYLVAKRWLIGDSIALNPLLSILLFVAGVSTMYLVKYLAILFCGWAFKIDSITRQYIFNIFLLNKILGIFILPFLFLIAFTESYLVSSVLIFSLSIILFFFINRYLRSWNIFGTFFQYSKFHFFTYLCASEILPLAIITKILVRGLLSI